MAGGGTRACLVIAVVTVGIAFGLAALPAQARRHHGCASPSVSAPRDPVNPLALPVPPSSGDPLQGAHFFVDGPKHGQAAGAVARLLGFNPRRRSVSESWVRFEARHTAAINRNPKARQLAKIADQEETQNVSLYAEGGGPGAIFGQTHKILCRNLSADPVREAVPVFSTYFIYPNGQACPSLDQLQRWQRTFHRYIDEMARAIGRKRAVILEDIDSIVLSSCVHGAAAAIWLGDLRYESQRFSKLPHAVTYAEAGYSDAHSAAWTARRLWQAGVWQVRGFYTNDTHFVWSIDEIHWANRIVRDLLGLSRGAYHAHFVVNTAQNGQGPKRNRHPFTQGNENLCNPPGRGLGRLPTADVHPTLDGRNFRNLDAFLWSGVPGRSHNSNCPNGPWKPGGVFDPRFALELARHANQRLGPGYRGLPY